MVGVVLAMHVAASCTAAWSAHQVQVILDQECEEEMV